MSLRLDQLARRMVDIGLRPGQALFHDGVHGAVPGGLADRRVGSHGSARLARWRHLGHPGGLRADDGIGLQPQELDEVFEPYARTAAARKIRGLGLGLYICRAIIEAHGGTLRARSEGRGKGTTLLFTLPTRPRSDGTPSVTHPH